MRSNESTVIVCTYNRSTLLAITLDALLQQQNARPFLLLVVDNGSTDNTSDIVLTAARAAPLDVELRYITEARSGLARARNTGLDHAEGEFVVFLDDDAEPCCEWLSSYSEMFRNIPQAGIIGGRVLPRFEITPPAWIHQETFFNFLSLLDAGEESGPMPAKCFPIGANFAVRRSLLNGIRFRADLGRSGKNLLSNEEIEFNRAIVARGARVFYSAEASVKHYVPRERLTQRWILRRGYYQGISDIVAGQKRAKWSTAIWESLRTGPTIIFAALFIWNKQRRISSWTRSAYRWGVARASWFQLCAGGPHGPTS